MPAEARLISVAGVVQGVGFRPFVYNLARQMGLAGWVLNHSGGVEIEVEGPADALAAFEIALRQQAPPLARIETLTSRPSAPQGFTAFEIRHSERQEGRYQLISPDVATCSDCQRELLDPANRRYRYPFINCTNCGPRFTIISDIPYDRPNTTMRAFPLCPACRREYEDPADRRFHAQPNACPVCGPHLWLSDAAGRPLAGDAERADNEAVLAEARRRLLAGQIVAVKGLGGFLLACDAGNDEAVRALRQRKRRPHKPFAIMVATLEDARRLCHIAPAEEALLISVQRPIVLLEARPNADLAGAVAPHSHVLGIMLPYTPLHHILLRDAGRPLVMTSGNLSEEPIASDNAEALRRLGGLADAFLLHNRDIYSRYDDSVWQVTRTADGGQLSAFSGQRSAGSDQQAAESGRRAVGGVQAARTREIAQPARRARGYAPFPIRLPFPVAPLLAAGADLKNAFCLARDDYAFLSQHIGDMEHLETWEHWEATLALYRRLFRLEPARVACDLHPDYLSTRAAGAFAQRAGLPAPLPIQHHRAHIAACLADNGWPRDAGAVIGVALDGTGYGDDGAIWGGEWLIGDYAGLRRAAHLEYLPLPGGDAATRQPARLAAGYLYASLGAAAVPAGLLPDARQGLLFQQIERRLNTPLTSSMGRLFDAVSALLGICREVSYEAQAAIELEQSAAPADAWTGYPFGLDPAPDGTLLVRLRLLLAALLEEQRRGAPAPTLAGRFHVTVAQIITAVCRRLRAAGGPTTVALSGGVFQNRLLTRLTVPLLEEAGFRVLLHQHVPTNDGGIALGQAVLAHTLIAAER